MDPVVLAEVDRAVVAGLAAADRAEVDRAAADRAIPKERVWKMRKRVGPPAPRWWLFG